MSKAKERALEHFNHYTAENVDEVIKARAFFQVGYEKAEKEMIEKAVSVFNKIFNFGQSQALFEKEVRRLMEEE